MTGCPREVVIVGRDAALWLTATALARALMPIGVNVTAVELPTLLGRCDVYSTLPAIETLHARLGIDEAALLRSTSGSFSMGWNIVPCSSSPFLLAHGSYGAPIDGADFFGHWVKARCFGLDVALENFSPTAMAARHGRVLVPDESTDSFGRSDYAYQLSAIAYAALLKSRAQRLGVTVRHAMQLGVELDSTMGSIRGVVPDGQALLTGDLFIDTTGPEGLLIGQAPGNGSTSWGQFFPFDHVITGCGRPFSPVPVYAEIRVAPGSWTAFHGTQTSTHVVHAQADEGSDPEALALLAANAAGLTLSEVEVRQFAPAIRNAAWAANCVAIGGAACAFDPLFDLELHSVQLGIVHLLSLFPAAADASAERAEYNRVTRSLFERLRDFQSVLYLLARSSCAVPDSVQQKLDAFEARGCIAAMEDETFSPDQWRALFSGFGVVLDSWPPSIDRTSPDRVKESFRRTLRFVRDKVLERATHDEYLASIGARVQHE